MIQRGVLFSSLSAMEGLRYHVISSNIHDYQARKRKGKLD